VVLDFPDGSDAHGRLLWLSADRRLHPHGRAVSPDFGLASANFGDISRFGLTYQEIHAWTAQTPP